MRTTPVVDPRPVDQPMCSLPTCGEIMMPAVALTWITASFGTPQVMTTVSGLQEYFCSWGHLSDWARLPLEQKVSAVKANGAPDTDLQAWGRVPTDPGPAGTKV